MTDNDNVISTLNNLIETCKDGQNGFQTASADVKNTELKTLFSQYSQERSKFAGELQQEVRTLGGDPENMGSVAATLHRGWINIKSTVTGSDDTAVLNECERGEDSAVSNYKDALGETLPANVREVVERQYQQVQQAHDRIRSLRDTSKGASA